MVDARRQPCDAFRVEKHNVEARKKMALSRSWNLCSGLLFALAFALASIGLESFRASPALCQEPAAPTSALARLPGDCTTVLYVADPLPHLMRVLNAPGLQAAISVGPDASPFLKDIDLAKARAAVEANKQFIPREIAVGVPPTAWPQVTNVVRTGVLAGLCYAAIAGNDAQAKVDFQRELSKSLSRLSPPNCYVVVSFRDSQTAQMVAAMMRQALQPVLARVKGAVVGESGVSLDVKLGDFMAGEQAITAMLQSMGLSNDVEGAAPRDLAAALADVPLKAEIEVLDDSLRFRLVGRAKESPRELRLDSLGPLWKPSPSLVSFAKWELASFQRTWLELATQWKDWEATPAGQMLVSMDTEAIADGLRVNEAEMSRWAVSGASVVSYDKTLDLVVQERGTPPSESLSAAGIHRFFPPRATTLVADSTRSFADVMTQQLQGFEGRLSNKSLRGGQTGKLADDLSDKYYKDFKRFRTLILKEAPTLFKAPYGSVARAEGHVDELRVNLATRSGKAVEFADEDFTVSEFAVIAHLNSEVPGGAKFFEQLYGAILQGFGDSGGQSLVKDVDLGLAVPTWTFTQSFWDVTDVDGRIEVEGDLLPHFFTVDQWLVLSTSPSLSKAMLESFRGSEESVKLPSFPERLVAVGSIQSAAYGQALKDLERVITVIAEQSKNDPGAHEAISQIEGQLQGVKELLQMAGRVVQLMKEVRWVSLETDEFRETRAKVVFVQQ
jgi:hypothetical protein